jgi:hypothetical protein
MLTKKAKVLKTELVAHFNRGLIRRNAMVVIIAAILFAGGWSCDSDNNGNTANNDNFSGLIDIGNGREMYLECIGKGSPTVVYIAGGLEAGWISKYALYSTDLIQEDPTNQFSLGRGDLQKLDRALFPTAGKLTRVCNYDRPNTTVGDDIELERGGQASTPVKQPHTVEQDVADLHALLTAANVPGPYVLVAHSYGGLIAELYASTYPNEVAGRVLIDVTNEYLLDTLTEKELMDLLIFKEEMPGHPDLERIDIIEAMHSVRNAPAPPRTPVFVLSADKPDNFEEDTLVQFEHVKKSHDMLAEHLCAKYMKRTNSAHHIFIEQPQLVNDAIREVVEAVRNGCTSIPCEGVPPKTDPSIVLPDCTLSR